MPEFIAAVARGKAIEADRAERRAQRTRVLGPLVSTLLVTVAALGWTLATRGLPTW